LLATSLFENLPPASDLWKLRDDVNVPNVKHSFISVEENGLSGGRESMMKLLRRSARWKKMLRKEKEGLASGIRDYESAVGKFLEYLLILIHITGGQPGCGTEITTLRYANATQSMRNVFVKEGRVMIVTEYHKSIAVADQVKVIPRFLPERVGRLLVVYLADVLPFHQLMDRKAAMLTLGAINNNSRICPNSWPTHYKGIWLDSKSSPIQG
jgi:hypothetical protein